MTKQAAASLLIGISIFKAVKLFLENSVIIIKSVTTSFTVYIAKILNNFFLKNI